MTFAPTENAANVEGAFDVILTDYDSKLIPPLEYRLTGSLRFQMGTSSPAEPFPAEKPLSREKSYMTLFARDATVWEPMTSKRKHRTFTCEAANSHAFSRAAMRAMTA